MLQSLTARELKRVENLEGIERARELAVEVAKGDHREYLRINLVHNEVILKELLYEVDIRDLGLLETKADLELQKETNDMNRFFRSFFFPFSFFRSFFLSFFLSFFQYIYG